MECRTCGWAQDTSAASCPRCGSASVSDAPTWVAPPPPPGWAPPGGARPGEAPSGWAAPAATDDTTAWARPDAVAAAAPAPAPFSPPPPSPDVPGWSEPDPTWSPPVEGTAVTPPGWASPPGAPPSAGRTGGGRRAVGLALAAVGAVAVLLVGALVVRAVLSRTDGASDPEAAVRRLAAALDAEDPVAVTAALAPDEVAGLADLFADLDAHAADLGLGADGDAFAGADVTVDDLELSSRSRGDGVAEVTVREGRIGWALDPDRSGSGAAALFSSGSTGEVTADGIEDAGGEPVVMTVHRNGGWYVSLTYTLAQQAVELLGLDRPDFDEDPADRRRPAATPEGAVVAFIEAVGSANAANAAAVAAEGESSVLVPYEDALEQLVGNGWLDLEVTDIDATVREDADGTARLDVASIEGTVNDDYGDRVGWSAEGLCVTIDEGYDDEASCGPIDPGTYLGRALTPDRVPSFVVAEERGGWVVSPLRSLVAYAADVLPALDADMVKVLFGRPDLVAPSGEAPLGSPTEVALGTAGVTTWTLTPDEDIELAATVRDDTSVAVVDDRGRTVTDWPSVGAAASGVGGAVLDAGRTYTVVLQREQRRGDAPVEVTLGTVATRDIGEISLAGTINETLTPAHPVHRTTFTVDTERRSALLVDGEAEATVATSDELVCSAGQVCGFVPDTTYTLTTSTSADEVPEEGLDVAVSFDSRELPDGVTGEATIDGTSEVDGVLREDGSAFHEVVVPDGVVVEVTVTADDPDADIDVDVDGEYYAAYGDEEFTLYGPLVASMEVYLFSGRTTGYTVTLTPA